MVLAKTGPWKFAIVYMINWYICNGYRIWITINTSGIVNIIYWAPWAVGSIPWELALKPRTHITLHTHHRTSEEIISQRIALKPRLYNTVIQLQFVHFHINVNPWRTSVTDIRVGQLRRTTAPDNGVRQLRRTTAPDNGVGQLRRTTAPDNGVGQLRRTTAPDTRVLGTLPKDQPGLGESTY